MRDRERIAAPAAVPILGVPLRTVQALAAKGELPTAARIGRRWTFNLLVLERFAKGMRERGISAPEYATELKQVVARPWENEGRQGQVYVAGYDAYVKIGFTARPPTKRLGELQIGAPVKLAIYGLLSGGKNLETRLHERFSQYRLEGDWFRIDGELARWIKRGCPRPAPEKSNFLWWDSL